MKHLELKTESYRYVVVAFGQWLESLGYAKPTVQTLPVHVQEMLFYMESTGIREIGAITPDAMKIYFESLKLRSNQRRDGALSQASLNKHLQALKRFLDYLRQSGRLSLPALDLFSEQPESEPLAILTKAEIQLLYKATEIYNNTPQQTAINARDRAMLSVFYGCGLRRSEGLNLRTGDIDFERQRIHIRKAKNRRERFSPLSKGHISIIENYLFDERPHLLPDGKETAFFISQRQKPMHQHSLYLRLKTLQKRTGNPELMDKRIGLHTLRHSIATHLLTAGMKLESISRFLGHSSLDSTQIYMHLIEEREK